MLHISTDIEADGPQVGTNSMISFGSVVCEDPSKTFYAEICPISNFWVPGALAVSGFTREQTRTFENPSSALKRYADWLESLGDRLMFVSDNNGFDWQFINWYLLEYAGRNPFGHSSMNLNSFYKGVMLDTRVNIKKLRKTKHTHNALDDAMGNAEAYNEIMKIIERKRSR